MLQPIRLVFQVVPLRFSVGSYLVSYLCSLTFSKPSQLVIVVVDFCLNFLSAMLNACVISSFSDWFHWSYALSFDLGLLLYIQEYRPCPVTRVYNVSLSLFTWALNNLLVLFTWTFINFSFSLCNVFTL